MGRNILDQKGRGFIGFLLWAALAALLGWLGWQLYQHPESLNPRPVTHSPLEDTHQ